MPIITIFSGDFCQENPVVQEVTARTGYRQITDDEIVAAASRNAAMSESKIKRAFSAKSSVFNKFTLENERSLVYIKLAVADSINDDNALITCYSGQLIPASISHTSSHGKTRAWSRPGIRISPGLSGNKQQYACASYTRCVGKAAIVQTERCFIDNEIHVLMYMSPPSTVQ